MQFILNRAKPVPRILGGYRSRELVVIISAGRLLIPASVALISWVAEADLYWASVSSSPREWAEAQDSASAPAEENTLPT